MIHQDDIKNKDFSEALPVTINKLHAISHLLQNESTHQNSDFGHCVEGQDCINDFFGLGYLLADIEDDLKRMNEALYGDNEAKEPEDE